MSYAGPAVLRVPVFGWLLRDAVYGRPEAKYYFLANCVLALVIAVWIFGYPALIVVADAAAWFSLALLIYMTAADSFSKANRKALADEKRRRRSV